MKKTDIERLFGLNGVEKNIYLFCVTDAQIKDDNYIGYVYHIKYRFVEFMRSKGVEYGDSTIKKAMSELKKAGYLRAGERRGDYFINYKNDTHD